MENSREMERGWPLGLGSIYVRVQLSENITIATTTSAAATTSTNVEPGSFYVNLPSTTFSSFSSSNLDTESTVSFFQDNSKTLGKLIGIKSRNNVRRTERFLRSSVDRDHDRLEEQEQRRRFTDHDQCSTEEHDMDIQMCTGVCVPLCLLSKTNTTSRS